MEISLEAVVETPDHEIDMKSGLETFQGVSDAMRKISQSLLNDEVVRRINYQGDVRTMLKESFEGSFGLRFSLEVLGAASQKRLSDIGVRSFIDLIHYFSVEARYGVTRQLTPGASKVLESISFSESDLIEEIRASCMRRIHKISRKFSHNLVVRARTDADKSILIGKFDRASAELLDPVFDPRPVRITASVSRLNINTGNGRIQLVGERTTTAFGFSGDYDSIGLKLKKAVSENLDNNNGVPVDKRDYIELIANRLILRGGKIVKYVVLSSQ